MTAQHFPSLGAHAISGTRDALPAGTTWQTDGFSGAVLRYSDLVKSTDPQSYLNGLWSQLLSAGREHMLESSN